LIKQRLPQKGTLDKSQPRDMFQTPRYATELLIPFIPKNITTIWECAAGSGKIVEVLQKYNYNVKSTDIDGNRVYSKLNFLNESMKLLNHTAIITNPPYSLKQKFFQKCLEYAVPFALLISADYCLWTIDAIRKYRCEKIIPDRRIDYITPTGKSGATGHSSYFHSLWITWGFSIGKTETFVELTKEMKKNI
jgi:hypothetical protein